MIAEAEAASSTSDRLQAPRLSVAGNIAYSMAMGAVVQMTRELSTEWAHLGFGAIRFLPGPGDQPQSRKTNCRRSINEDEMAERNSSRTHGSSFRNQGLIVLLPQTRRTGSGTLIPMDGGNLAANAGATIRPPVG